MSQNLTSNSCTLRDTLSRFRDRTTTTSNKRRKLDTGDGSEQQRREYLIETWAAQSIVNVPPTALLGNDPMWRVGRQALHKEDQSEKNPERNGEKAKAKTGSPPGTADGVATNHENKTEETEKGEEKDSEKKEDKPRDDSVGGKKDDGAPTVDSLVQTDMERYKQLIQQEQAEIDAIQAKRQRIKQEQVEVWGVYKYGLEKIANLPDLGLAPDAILPGNF